MIKISVVKCFNTYAQGQLKEYQIFLSLALKRELKKEYKYLTYRKILYNASRPNPTKSFCMSLYIKLFFF